MSDHRLESEIEQIHKDFPALVYFMQCYWNQNFDDFYGHFEEAVEHYAQSNPESLVRDLLEQIARAKHDENLCNLLEAPFYERSALSNSWGGVTLEREAFGVMEAVLKQCLDSGQFLPQGEIQRRREAAPEYIAEFKAIIKEIKVAHNQWN